MLYSNSVVSNFFARRGSNEIRSSGFMLAYEIAQTHLLIGNGLAHGIGQILDSTLMNLLVDTGILGLVVFLGLCVYCMVRLIRNRSDLNNPFCLMLICFFVEMIAESVLFNTSVNCLMGIIWFLCLTT